MSLRTRAWASATAALVLGVSLVSCDAAENSGAATPPAGTTIAAPAPDGPDEVTTGLSGLAEIPQTAGATKAFVEKLQVRPTDIVWHQPLTKPIPQNKTIAVLELGVPDAVNIDNWIQNAADDIGWKVARIQAGVSAETFKAAMDQAVRMKPDAVMLTSFPREVYESELAELDAMHVPVVGLTVASKTGGGLVATLAGGPRYERMGQVYAAQVAADSGGKGADTLVTLVPEYSTSDYVKAGFQAAYPVLCPGCKSQIRNFGAVDIGTKVPSEIVSYLQANPKVHYLVMFGTFMATGVVPALRSAGLLDRVKIFTHDLDPSAAQDMAQGVNETNYSAAASDMAYRGVDIVIRYLSGDPSWQDSARTGLPEWIATNGNLPADAAKGYVPTITDMRAQYDKLWGVARN